MLPGSNRRILGCNQSHKPLCQTFSINIAVEITPLRTASFVDVPKGCSPLLSTYPRISLRQTRSTACLRFLRCRVTPENIYLLCPSTTAWLAASKGLYPLHAFSDKRLITLRVQNLPSSNYLARL
jgi:hypothetical protein